MTEILYTLATEILMKLGSLAAQELGSLWGLKDDLSKLRDTVSAMEAVFLDVEEKQGKSREVKNWVRKLRAVFFEADDLLDDFYTEITRRNLLIQKNPSKKISIFFSKSNPVLYSLEIHQRLKVIRGKLEAIEKDKHMLHLVEKQSVDFELPDRETHSFVNVDEVIGREDEKRAIVDCLLDVRENVSVVPIVGIGGLGKTTLAQLVYNDDRVKKHFELRIWVYVSHIFNVKLIVEKMIESITSMKPQSLHFDRLQDQLRKEIDGKKYLLVLDDMWNENRETWLKLQDLLIGGARGSKVLVTTRSGLVAAAVGTATPCNLKGLPEDMSWSLFSKLAFKPGEEINSSLVAIGKEILRKCAGVPLAIRILGSFLYYKETEAEWLYVKNHQLTDMAESADIEILPILKLSYDHLPIHLKHCFSYCSLFQRNQTISKKTLIQLWIAQGFIRSNDEENECLEDVGERYFMGLLRRSFFQDVKEHRLGNIISCKMHDLIHDLAKMVAENETLMLTSAGNNSSVNICHLSVGPVHDSAWELPHSLLKEKNLRTFFMPTTSKDSLKSGRFIGSEFFLKQSKLVVDAVISNFRSLRVLDLHGLGINEVPGSVSMLKHLRYIDLSENNFVTLPKSMSKMLNLQTLKLSCCFDLCELPENIHKMVNIRHLEVDGCLNLSKMPCRIGQLTSLRTLSQFVIGQETSTSSRVSAVLTDLNGLVKLGGKLTIRNLGCIECLCPKIADAVLKNKEYLQSLRLEWTDQAARDEYDELLLEGLQPHENLKVLFIERYRGQSFPKWMMVDMHSALPKLTKLTLKNLKVCKSLPPFGCVPSLQYLKLESLTLLEYIEHTSYDGSQFGMELQKGSAMYFPSLKELKLCNLPCLKGWWKKEVMAGGKLSSFPVLLLLSSFPSLSKLTIQDCLMLEFMPINPRLEELNLIRVSNKLLQQLMMLLETALSANCSSFLAVSKLKSLYILDVRELFLLPEGLQNLSLLDHLEINGCPNLSSLQIEGMRALNMLRFLHVHDCGLTSLSEAIKHLYALETLVISSCKEINLSTDNDQEYLQFKGLKSLQKVYIQEIPKLVHFPVWLQYLPSLRVLHIEKCYSLLDLPDWISDLKSLHELFIYKCPKLTSIPAGMVHLTSLEELRILMCPNIWTSCQNEQGEDWPKIAHIPKVIVK